jgi:hypothetical protein
LGSLCAGGARPRPRPRRRPAIATTRKLRRSLTIVASLRWAHHSGPVRRGRAIAERPHNRDNPHSPLCSEAVPALDRGPGRPAIATIRNLGRSLMIVASLRSAHQSSSVRRGRGVAERPPRSRPLRSLVRSAWFGRRGELGSLCSAGALPRSRPRGALQSRQPACPALFGSGARPQA